MTSQEGRPYCTSAGMYLTEEGKTRDVIRQCRECKWIIFIGCSSFKHRQETCDADARKWAEWWYGLPHNQRNTTKSGLVEE